MLTHFSKKLALLLALTVSFPAFASPDVKGAETPKPAEASSSPIALAETTVVAKITVDGKVIEITFAQLKDQLKSLPANIQKAPLKEIYDPLLQNAINLAIINSKARTQGIDKDPETLRRISECQDAMLQRTFLEREVGKLQTPEELKKAYDEIIKILPKVDQVRLSQAIFKKEADAKKFINQVKKANSFEKALTEAKSHDKEIEGGDVDNVRIDSLPPELAKELSKAAKATLISKPIPVELGGNKLYFVVRVNDKSPAPQPTFEQLEGEIKQITFQKSAKTVLEKLIAESKVEKVGLDGKPMVETQPTTGGAAAPAMTPPAAVVASPQETTTPAPAAAPAAAVPGTEVTSAPVPESTVPPATAPAPSATPEVTTQAAATN